MYDYNAKVVSIHDGDTLTLAVDLGFGVSLPKQVFRLAGCNAIELKNPGGEDALLNLLALMPIGSPCTVHSLKINTPIPVDNYGGRYDAAIQLPSGQDLVSFLIDQQWAAPWNGRGTAPLPPWPRTVA